MRRATVGVLVVGVLGVAGCSADTEGEMRFEADTSVTLTVPERDAPELPLRPEHPEGPAGASSLLSGLLADDERFGTVRLDRSGSLVLVWHGDPPLEALASVAEAYPDVPVRVEPLDVLPGDLQGLAESLLGGERRPGIGAASVRDDLSAIVVQVAGPVANPLTLAERLSAEVGFPVEVEVSAP